MANSVNFIDGLDGLAAGIVAIGPGLFIYAHQLGDVGNISSQRRPLIAVIAVGICVASCPTTSTRPRSHGGLGAML